MTKIEYEKILSDLKTLGVTRVDISYNDGNDSSNIEGIQFFAGGREVEVPQDLHEPLSDLGWDIAMKNHAGFYNNDGGYGKVLIHVQDGTWFNPHSDYETVTRDSENEGEVAAMFSEEKEEDA